MKKAQSFLEYTILLMIIIAAFLTMQAYVKRGFQGRWKQAMDDVGEQYDANSFSSNMRYTQQSESESRTQAVYTVVNDVNGLMTYRTDKSTSTETKTGGSRIDPPGN
jgi:hypothetical protein